MKLKLFPHSVQKPAAILFVCSLVLVLAVVVCMVSNSFLNGQSSISPFIRWINSTGLIYFRILLLTSQISLALLLFSEEKVEDEMINYMRLRAVAISAAIVIGLKIIASIIWMLLPADFISSFAEIRNDFKGAGISTMIILYLLLFRTSIRKYTTESNEE